MRAPLALLLLALPVVTARSAMAQGTCAGVCKENTVIVYCSGTRGDNSTPIADILHVGIAPPPPQGGINSNGPWAGVPFGLSCDGMHVVTSVSASNYFPWNPGFGILCTRSGPPDCLSISCGGCNSFPLFSMQGSFHGKVTGIPATTDSFNGNVGALGTQGSGSTSINPVTGEYQFAGSYGNHWSLGVEGGGSSRGSGTYTLTASGTGLLSESKEATTFSNENIAVDFTLQAPWMEDPSLRCDPPPPPAPPPGSANLGNPVNVTTGNVFFDQTDATIPGVASHGLRLTRSYNSANAAPGRYGVFGPGWSNSYEKRLKKPDDQSPPVTSVLILREGNGVPKYFHDPAISVEEVYEASVPFTEPSSIRKNADGTFDRVFIGGGLERYAALSDPNVARRGRLVAIADAAGNTTTLGHDGQGRVTSITDAGPAPRQLTLQYNGPEITLSGPAGLIAIYTMNAEGILGRVDYGGPSGPDGSFSFTYATYAGQSRLTTITDGAGRVIETHEYDSAGRGTTSAVSENVEKLTLDYQADKTVVTDARGNVTTYEYVSIWGSKLVTKITGPCLGCGGGGGDVQEWTYDDKGRVISYRDGAGNLTTYAYDPTTGDLLSETRTVDPNLNPPVTHVRSYTYYPRTEVGAGRVHTITKPNGQVTTYTYGPAGPTSIAEQTAPGTTRTTTIQYYANGKPELLRDPREYPWRFSYTTVGDLDWIEDPLGNRSSFTYDIMGRRTQVIRPAPTPPDPAIQEPITTYDTLGRVKRITEPDDATYTEFTYDGGGRRTRVRDPLGRITEYVYDPVYGRLERIKDAKLGETVFTYDLMSNVTSLVDPHGGTTTFEYDNHNRLEFVGRLEDQSGGRREHYTYDAAGHLQTKRDLRLVVTTYSYDGIGRLTGKSYSDGTPAVTFRYDENAADQKGQLTSATTGPITLRWTYDLAGQTLSAVRQKQSSIRELGYSYDAAGNRKTLSLDGANILTYDWDARGLLDYITRAPDRVFDFSYDNAARRKGLLFPNTVLTSYGYDQRSRLTKVEAMGQSLISQVTYPTFDALNNRKSRAGATAPAETYDYDELYRLLTVNRGGPPAAETYSYDPAGNRVTSATIPTWTYNLQNRLTSNSAATFNYDFNGNVITKVEGGDTWSYEWDAENRLKRVLKNGSEVSSYIYDALGRRAERILSYIGAEYRRHLYVYDGEDIIREGFTNSFFEGSLLEGDRHIYVHGPGIDEPLEVEHGDGQVWYYHADGLGSIVRATDINGVVVPSASRQYDAFGNLQQGATEEGYAYTGREWDPEAGLYYYRARYYDPKIGRFVSEDPIGFEGGDNFYPYVQNNPVNRIDPDGQQVIIIPGPPPVPPLVSTCELDCKDFLTLCNLTAATAGVGTSVACFITCAGLSRAKAAPLCRTVCVIVGANVTATLKLGCWAGYQACLKTCKTKQPCMA